MRIIGGTYRGLQLESVGRGDAAAHLRPTTDRVREAVFNLLAHGGYASPQVPQEMRVLDLFAGTGAMGLEAYSRGAAHVTLVDQGKVAAKLQRANIARMAARDHVRMLKADATALPPCPDEPYDLILLDPPYGQKLGKMALKSALTQNWVSEKAVVVLEDNAEILRLDSFQLNDRRNYAESHIHIFSRI